MLLLPRSVGPSARSLNARKPSGCASAPGVWTAAPGQRRLLYPLRMDFTPKGVFCAQRGNVSRCPKSLHETDTRVYADTSGEPSPHPERRPARHPAGYPPPRLELLASSRGHERPRLLSGGTGTLPGWLTPSTVHTRIAPKAWRSRRSSPPRRMAGNPDGPVVGCIPDLRRLGSVKMPNPPPGTQSAASILSD